MEDFIQIGLFILFAIFSFVSNLLNKRKKQQAETRKSKEETEGETRRPRRRSEVSSPDEPDESEQGRRQKQPSTFEEILRELTGESPARPKEQQAEQAEVEIEEKFEDDYEHPFSQHKETKSDSSKAQKAEEEVGSFRKSVRQAKTARRITDKIDFEQEISSKRLEVKRTKAGRKKKNSAALIARSLRSPDSARRAIILSEIINPKHF